MKKHYILIGAVAIAVIAAGVWGGFKYRASHTKDLASKSDPLSTKYEMWTIKLSGSHSHKKCKGLFKEEYVAKILFPGSLSKIIGQPATEPVQKIIGTAKYAGDEKVVKKTHLPDWDLLSAQMENVSATVTAQWELINGKSHLSAVIDSKGPLMQINCSHKAHLDPKHVHKLALTVTGTTKSTIDGAWKILEDKEHEVSAVGGDGTFQMSWDAGGPSGIPIPGPINLRAMNRSDGSILVEWTSEPLAKQYEVYFTKGTTFSREIPAGHGSSFETFAAITPDDLASPYAFVVSALIDGIETQVSNVLVFTPPPPKSDE